MPAMANHRLLACASMVALIHGYPASAQETAAPQASAQGGESTVADNVAAPEVIDFSADHVAYDNVADTVTATGNVSLIRGAWRLRANEVIWNRRSGGVTARGDVALTNPQGDIAYGDSVELTDTLRDGVVDNLLVVFEQGGRLAASRGQRLANGNLELDIASYTPCPIETPDGCPKKPSWLIRAVHVTYDAERQYMRYSGARVELFGLSLFPLPAFSHPVGGQSVSGLLVPDIRIDRRNGVEIATPYYFHLSPNLDATVTPHFFTNVAPLIEGEARGLSQRGAWRVRGLGTYSRRVSVSGATIDNGANDFRGYIEGSAGYQLSPEWSASTSFRVASDRTFLRRYDLSRDDRLRSTFTVARQGENSYFRIQGWATETLRVNDSQGQQPIALPLIDWRYRIADAPLGGVALLQANTLALTRTSGQDTQRGFASAQWDWRRLTTMGQEIRLTALGRADIYHTTGTSLTAVADYRGQEGLQGRAYALAAAEISWPMVGQLGDGTQRLVPRVQVVATSPVDNIAIPNEDSRAFDLGDDNIFALNRFPGHDRFEDGARVTYGVDWHYNRPGLSVSTTIAQSYRLDDQPQLFVDGTGLSGRLSDIVGRTTVAFRNAIRLTHRFRLDRDSLAVRRNEIDATFGTRQTYAVVGYARLNRNIVTLGEDLRDREEARVAARVQIARYWSVFGSAIVDLTDRAEDPLSVADGFTPIRHRLGIQYEDECLTLGVSWRRDYIATGDARAGNSFLLRLEFRNLGV